MARGRRRWRPSSAPPVPELVELRFTRYRRSYRVTYEQYMRIMERDNWTCRYCGADAGQVEMGIDHVIPVIIGGSNRDSNLVASCIDCNAAKSDTVDAVRVYWTADHYAEMLRILIRDRNRMQEAAVELARESRERFGKRWRLPGIEEIVP